jgi:8-oxo-dGTP diphosphatase
MNRFRRSAIIALVDDNKILLQLRDSKPKIKWPNFWGLPGGRVRANETLINGAAREINEETGYKAMHLELIDEFIIKEEPNLFIKYFVFSEIYDKSQRITCYEGQQMEFKTLEELKTLNLKPFSEKIAKKILAKRTA